LTSSPTSKNRKYFIFCHRNVSMSFSSHFTTQIVSISLSSHFVNVIKSRVHLGNSIWQRFFLYIIIFFNGQLIFFMSFLTLALGCIQLGTKTLSCQKYFGCVQKFCCYFVIFDMIRVKCRSSVVISSSLA
jgi:hypothetical protein